MGTFRTIQYLFSASAAAMLATFAGATQAAVVISNDATQNMNCSNGVCEPTAANAVLNTGDLETLLSSGSVEVTTTGLVIDAHDIQISDPFTWSTGSRLTLKAHDTIAVMAAVTVEGQGGLSLAPSGTLESLFFGRDGYVSFANLSSQLSINGFTYTLEDSIKSLATAIANNPSGDYALANSYDASNDGTYSRTPIGTPLRGDFEGLGNTISNLKIVGASDYLSLFAENLEAVIRDITLEDASVTSTRPRGGYVGALVAYNAGVLIGAHATGSVTGSVNMGIGGLVGTNTNRGYMYGDDANAAVVLGVRSSGGGLAGSNFGSISESYAVGTVTGSGKNARVGGLTGSNAGEIDNSYARAGAQGYDSGGLIGYNEYGPFDGYASSSYSTGKIKAADFAGGLIGVDQHSGDITDTYWDTSTSKITNLSQGAGSPPNDPGITGLTTTQLQSGLPAGFDPSVWAESASINNGLPYLISDPPE